MSGRVLSGDLLERNRSADCIANAELKIPDLRPGIGLLILRDLQQDRAAAVTDVWFNSSSVRFSRFATPICQDSLSQPVPPEVKTGTADLS